MQFSVKAHAPKIFKIPEMPLPHSELTRGLTPFYSCSEKSQGSSLGKVIFLMFLQVLPTTSKKGPDSVVGFLNFIQVLDFRG